MVAKDDAPLELPMTEYYAPQVVIPWHLKGKPYEVQVAAFWREKEAINNHGLRGFGDFLEMGLGKTALRCNKVIEYWKDIAITVCPNSFKMDWYQAFPDWGVDGITTLVWGRHPWRDPKPNEHLHYVINWEALRGKGGEAVNDLMERYDADFGLDETSYIKSFNSDIGRKTLDLSKIAYRVDLLNGTPQTQSVMDIYNQLRCIGELQGRNPYAFRNRYCNMGGYKGKKVLGVKLEMLDELHEILARSTIRALKRDWRKDIPPKQYAAHAITMTDRQREVYLEMYQDYYTYLEDHDAEIDAQMVITQQIKLQQISSGFIRDPEGRIHHLVPPKQNPKALACVDLVDLCPGKTIIAFHHKPVFDILQAVFGPNCPYIIGRMDDDLLVRNKKQFNEADDKLPILCQISAAKMGHTLLGPAGQRCTQTIFFENTDTLLNRLQMEDRNHRGDQSDTVNIIDLVASPVEKKIADNNARKAHEAEIVVDARRLTPAMVKAEMGDY